MTNSPFTYAIVFPGQGSQSVGMLKDIAERYPIVKETFQEASTVLGYDAWELISVDPQEQLDQTQFTQPMLLAASYAIWRVLAEHQLTKPAALAGHSLGEYTALVCANALSFTDALRLVAMRGEFMQAAVPAGIGAMAAIIGLDEQAVLELCDSVKEEGEVLAPANYNSIGQVVIAGHKEAVDRAVASAKEKGAKMAVFIPVSVPSHSTLMQPAQQQLKPVLDTVTLHTPSMRVLNNVDVSYYQDATGIRDGLLRQLASPVRWVETMQTFASEGITTIIECGPGKVLSGLNRRIDKRFQLFATYDIAQLEAVLQLEEMRVAS